MPRKPKDIYSRIVFSPDSNSKLSDLIIIPDHLIDEVKHLLDMGYDKK